MGRISVRPGGGVPGQPVDHRIDLTRSPPLALYLGDVEPVDAGDRGGEDAVGHGGRLEDQGYRASGVHAEARRKEGRRRD